MSNLESIQTTVDIPAYLVKKVDEVLKEDVIRSKMLEEYEEAGWEALQLGEKQR